MLNELKKIRNELLENNCINEYYAIMAYFTRPLIDEIDGIINNLNEDFAEIISGALVQVVDIYETDIKEFRRIILYGQCIIWSQVIECYNALTTVKDKIMAFRLGNYSDDYLQACTEVARIFQIYAESQIEMSRFENALGIDRSLDTLCADDIRPLEKIMAEIKEIFEVKITPYKKTFTEQWNTSNIAKIIAHQLVRYDGNNQICTLFECDKNETVLFIIDGFGFSQYQWYKNMNRDSINYTYKENIFSWLRDSGDMKEYALGSAYVTDTGAGLAQIFSGKTAKETGIISSKIGRSNTSNFSETKRIDKNTFLNMFQTNNSSSITEIISLFNKKSKVFYGSRYGQSISGFSDFIFKGADITEVLPPERIFSILKDELSVRKPGLDVVYLTGIDNSGHTMGAYSKFETFEHEKFNMLFRNFLIELAIEKPEYFDGKTTILITADHGMAESSKLMISRKTIKDWMFDKGIRNISFVENNRALLVYGTQTSELDIVREYIEEYFNEIGVNVEILVKNTEEYKKHYMTDYASKISVLAPDIVIRLIDNGLFYSKETSPHLLHYGGHGGGSAGETFVPLLEITLNEHLMKNIVKRFINLS